MNKLLVLSMRLCLPVALLGILIAMEGDAISVWTAIGIITTSFLLTRGFHNLETRQVVPERVHQALDTLAEGLLVLDETERIVLANRSFSKMVGMANQQLVRVNAAKLAWICSDDNLEGDFPWSRSLLEARPLIDQMILFARGDGSRRVFAINCSPIIPDNDAPRGVLATFRDVTEVEQHRASLESMLQVLKSSRDEAFRKNEELEILASIDALTSCLNRRAFVHNLSGSWNTEDSDNPLWACLMVDADRFKQINDSFGHAGGDDVLRRIANAIREELAPQDVLCRYGGEEFCAFLKCKSTQHAKLITERIRQRIESLRWPPTSALSSLQVTVSIGIACRSQRNQSPDTLIQQADKALYQAKNAGRNCVVLYSGDRSGDRSGDANSADTQWQSAGNSRVDDPSGPPAS